MSKRIAFLTTEFIHRKKGGGLANYLFRICRSLISEGHDVEVFMPVAGESRVVRFEGITINEISYYNSIWLRVIKKVIDRIGVFKEAPWGGPVNCIIFALTARRGLHKRYKQQPFDIIHSTNLQAISLLLKKYKSSTHIIRLSSKRDLWFLTDRRFDRGSRVMAHFEKLAISKADLAYAPSLYVARECAKNGWRKDIKVIRPPVFKETISKECDFNLPQRYMVFFGQIGNRKGTNFLAKALLEVWKEEPEFKMVWIGAPIRAGDFEVCRSEWAGYQNVIWMGKISKPELYFVVENAEASVLPSIVDNLPNTVIESLLLGVPVVGFRTGSIDELVENEKNGILVEPEDIDALAKAMLKLWRKEIELDSEITFPKDMMDEMRPDVAVRKLIEISEHSNF